MSFAEEYLELATKCHNLDKISLVGTTLFGFKITQEIFNSNGYACDSVMYRTEEYEDSVNGALIFESEYISFEEYDPLFNTKLIDEANPSSFEGFVKNILYDKYTEFDESYLGTREEAFIEGVKLNGLPKYLISAFYTAHTNYIIGKYQEEYSLLKTKYPGLPYYPPFAHHLECDEDYYETSRC